MIPIEIKFLAFCCIVAFAFLSWVGASWAHTIAQRLPLPHWMVRALQMTHHTLESFTIIGILGAIFTLGMMARHIPSL